MNPIITEAAFKKRIEASPVGGYLFFGDEDYLKIHAIKYARDKVCYDQSLAVFNDMRIDFSAVSFSADLISSAIAAAPMMADAKVVTVVGLDLSELNAESMDKLVDAVASIEEFDFNTFILSLSGGIVDMEEVERKKYPEKFARLCEKLVPVRFDSVPDAKLASWVVRHFEHNRVKVEEGVPFAMFEKCGRNMFTLVNEVDKLSYYVLADGREAVSRGDVELVTSINEDFDSFALGAAVTSGDAEKALRILGVKKAKKVEPVLVLGELSGTFADMLAVKLMTAAGVPPLEIGATMKWKGDYRANIYRQAVQNVSEERIRRAVDLCRDADAALKSSYAGYEEIEKLICLAV